MNAIARTAPEGATSLQADPDASERARRRTLEIEAQARRAERREALRAWC